MKLLLDPWKLHVSMYSRARLHGHAWSCVFWGRQTQEGWGRDNEDLG